MAVTRDWLAGVLQHETTIGRFQSRESKGGSTDMFVANFNGTVLINLCEADESAYDGSSMRRV